MAEATAGTGLGQEQSTASTTDAEPSPWAVAQIAAEIARVAHYLLGTGMDGLTKREAARYLSDSARKLNALSPERYAEKDLDTILGRAATLEARRLAVIIGPMTQAARASVVLAVDPASGTAPTPNVGASSSTLGIAP